MDKESEFLHKLNKDGKASNIPYIILAGNVQAYQSHEAGFWNKVKDKALEIIGDIVNQNHPNDIAVLTSDIKVQGKNTEVIPFDIPCHHLNYFVQEDSVQKLLDILKK